MTHRHQGIDWASEAVCPVCEAADLRRDLAECQAIRDALAKDLNNAHAAKTLAEEKELSCAAELDETYCELVTFRDALTDMTAERDALVDTLREILKRIEPLAPLVYVAKDRHTSNQHSGRTEMARRGAMCRVCRAPNTEETGR